MSDNDVETLFKGTITNTELAKWLEKATEGDGRPGFKLAVERLEDSDRRIAELQAILKDQGYDLECE